MNRFLIVLFFVGCLAQAQHQENVDFIRAEAFIAPIASEKEIVGSVTYDFKVLQQVDSVFLDAKNMEFSVVTLDGKPVDYLNTKKVIAISHSFKKGASHQLKLQYTVKPKQTVYFIGTEETVHNPLSNAKENQQIPSYQIWTQGQGKYTSYWLPSFDAMEEKVEFDISIKANALVHVIANGKRIEKRKDGEAMVSKFDMQKPMSSYLLAFAIGNYKKQSLKADSGVEIENYYYPQDSLKVEPTYRYTKQIFNFLEAEIGVAYPWQNYKQIPVKDFLYAGMENTSATIFSDAYVIDSTAFIDKNYVNVNAHELAHQWFGNLVTEKNSNHHWLHEGFATFYAQLAEKEVFGDDYYYFKLYHTLLSLQEEASRGKGQKLTDPKASSLIFYEKGAWALYMLRNEVGAKRFKKGIRNYLKKYQFKNVTISNFLTEIEAVSSKNLSAFKAAWLSNTEVPFEAAKKQLAKDSKALRLLFSLEKEEEKGVAIAYEAYWNQTTAIPLKKHLLKHYRSKFSDAFLKQVFDSKNIPLRQVLAQGIDTIPPALKKEYESLLTDNSYRTVETALYKLWEAYPEERKKYLDQTADIQGFRNKNVRLLWLTLAIVTENYKGRETGNYFDELNGYTAPKYGWETRMSAFQYLNQALVLNEQSLKNLINACVHHSWQFKKYARNLVKRLQKDEDYKMRLKELQKKLKGDELRYILKIDE